MLEIKSVSKYLGAVLSGLDLSKPLSADILQQVIVAIHNHGLLIIRNQNINEEDYLNFCRYFGAVRPSIDPKSHHPQYPEIKVLKNTGKDAIIAAPAYMWHQDAFNMQEACRFTFMRAIEAPEDGGETVFLSTRVAFDNLTDARKKEINDLKVLYKSIFKNYPPHCHPMVRTDEINHRKSLYVNKERALGIVGMETDVALALINDIFAQSIIAHEPLAHYYRPGDVLMWDNYAVQHAATEKLPPNKVRILQRVYVPGEMTPC